MRVLVTGGRNYDDWENIQRSLDDLHAGEKITAIIEGGAGGIDDVTGKPYGADRLARLWASNNGVRCVTYEAEWDKFGKSAGPIRNQLMLDDGKPDLVVAFPGGRGTANMIAKAIEAGVTLFQYGHPVEFFVPKDSDAQAAE